MSILENYNQQNHDLEWRDFNCKMVEVYLHQSSCVILFYCSL